MPYLIDTNIIVRALRYGEPINPKILEEGVAISVVSYGELLYGAEKSIKSKQNMADLEDYLSDLDFEIIPIDRKIIQRFAAIKSGAEKKGRRQENFDLLIAATALVHNLTLITHNTKHFSSIENLKTGIR